MRLYFSRHGESEANVQQVFSNGLGVFGLTQKGRQQARQLADHLQDIDFTALYCSPILRAVQTAGILAARLHIPYEIEDGLREYDVGVLEGRSYDEASLDMYWEVTAQWMERRNWEARITGGESYNDIQARFMPFIRRLEDAYRETDANVLLIGHGGTYRCMLPLLLSNIDYDSPLVHHIGYTTPVIAELCGTEWVCLQWGDQVL